MIKKSLMGAGLALCLISTSCTTPVWGIKGIDSHVQKIDDKLYFIVLNSEVKLNKDLIKLRIDEYVPYNYINGSEDKFQRTLTNIGPQNINYDTITNEFDGKLIHRYYPLVEIEKSRDKIYGYTFSYSGYMGSQVRRVVKGIPLDNNKPFREEEIDWGRIE